MSFVLRDYQAMAVSAAHRVFTTKRAALIVCPTATGKTLIAATVLRDRMPLGRQLVVGHTEELVTQAANKVSRVTMQSVDIEKADKYADGYQFGDWKAPTIVASVQTLNSRRGDGFRMNRFNPMDFATIWFDECHRATAASYRRVLDHFGKNPNLKVLGVTATPDRHDEQALGQIFDELAFEYSIHQAMEDGWIVPLTQTIVNVDGMDFSHIKTTAGDLNGGELNAEMEREENIHRIADPLFRLADKRRTLVFTPSVKAAHMLAEVLNRHESDCAVAIDGSTPDDYRRDLVRAYARDAFRFLINVGCFTEGFDDPGIQVVGMARPTKSRSLFCQMVGRGFRVLPGVVDDLTDATAQRQLGLNGEPESMVELRRRRIATSEKPRLEILDFVGVCGKHKLACAIDIFAGKESDEVLEEAKRIAAKSPGKPVKDSVAEAKREIEKRHRDKEEARKRKHIIGRASFSTQTVDPFEAANTFIREVPLSGGPLASVQSTEYLKKLFKEFGYDVSKVSREWGQRRVSTMINKLKAKRAGGPPSNAMKWKLRQLGCNRGEVDAMTWAQAHDEITRRMGQAVARV